jgi:gluconolactonase
MPIEQFASELQTIISLSEPIQMLADGFGGPQGPAEGPLWWQEGHYLLFSDIHNNRRLKSTSLEKACPWSRSLPIGPMG